MHILSSSTYSVVSPSPSPFQGPFKTVWTPWHIQVTEQPILGPTSLHSRNSPMCSLVLKLKFSTVKSVMSFLLKYWKPKHHLQHVVHNHTQAYDDTCLYTGQHSPQSHTSLRWHVYTPVSTVHNHIQAYDDTCLYTGQHSPQSHTSLWWHQIRQPYISIWIQVGTSSIW